MSHRGKARARYGMRAMHAAVVAAAAAIAERKIYVSENWNSTYFHFK